MPTYEFRCPEGHEFEKFYRSIGAAPREVHCPVCGKMAERQLSAGGGLLFRGSGFYITDYGKDGKKPQTTPAAESGSSGSGDASKSESGAKAEPKATEAKPAKEPKSADKKAADKSGSSGKAKGTE
ncbi:MAG TPA: zinc ribbon domain-containing protein [Gemmatimonadaceae bacterium]|nr:zinc ribbon domain-containing protein [Gemmatimonadaceae bacterium]